MSDVWVRSETERQKQEQRFEHYQADASLTPRADGTLDLMNEWKLEDWNSAVLINTGGSVAVSIPSMRATSRMSGINRDRIASLLAAIGGLIGALPPPPGTLAPHPNLPPTARAQLRLAVQSLRDMLSGIELEETLDGVRVEIAGVGGLSIKHAAMGMGGESTDGRLRGWFTLALHELAGTSLPPNIAEYLPHHLEIKPTISGVPMTDLQKLALDATDEDATSDRFAPDLAALFSHGPIEVGLETLSFDLGAAKVDGTGTISVTSARVWHGKAHLESTGLDQLTTQARTRPELQSALPALIMIRGLAKQEGEHLVWDIAGDGKTTTVNGFDLSQLGGGEKSKSGPPVVRKPGQTPSR
jgi:hypothetical protein